MSISIDGKRSGEIELGLFGDVVPKTVENFKELCIGKRVSPSGVKLRYKGSKFHRIVTGFMIQGGDFTRGDGKGGESIYGGKFEDENFEIKHFEGCLSMANGGANSNGSQFFITTAPTKHLDGMHVVFGKVLKNMELVRKIETYGGKYGRPGVPVVIDGCKVLPGEKPRSPLIDYEL